MFEITTYTVANDHHNWSVKVQASKHAQKRFDQRNIDVDWFVLAADVMSLGKSILSRIGRDVAVIDKKHDITIIVEIARIGKRECEVNIITILDKADCFVKNGTEIHKLK